ncbi:MAG: hypothetical protein ACREOK_02890 [Gemmatimonadaceae bacterium]
MRCLSGLGLLVPALLFSQEPAQQSAPSAEWATRREPTISAYEAHRAKARAKIDKNLKDLARREDAWLVVARDEFGLSEANRLDPGGFARAVRQREGLVRREDSSATAFLAAARSAELQAARAAVEWRERHLATFLADSDTLAVHARELLKWAQRLEDLLRGEDNPSRSAATRDYVKKSLDYYEKLIRLARTRISHHSEFSEILREEMKMMDTHFAALKATQ